MALCVCVCVCACACVCKCVFVCVSVCVCVDHISMVILLVMFTLAHLLALSWFGTVLTSMLDRLRP